MAEQLTFFGDNPEYDAFVAKFEPKKTTDDCYTPPMVYEAVRDWACAEYGLDPARIVRPFYPGGDYERFDYGDGAVVLDNPPFSILVQIIRFYQKQNIPFFLFGPTLTAFSSQMAVDVCHLICDAKITYENGAVVNTSFVTNLEPGVVVRSAPGLYQAVTRADARNLAQTQAPTLPKYAYPDQVLTAAGMRHLGRFGVEFQARREDCAFIRALDMQRAHGKTIFGGGLPLSDKAAAARATADRAAAERKNRIVWELSEREWAIVKNLGRKEGAEDGECGAEPGL